MLRLVFLSLLASGSGFHILGGTHEPGSYHIQLVEYGGLPRERHSLCLPTPFLRQICLPTALQFFMPQRTVGPGDQRCLTLPTMTAYVVRVCPRKGTREEVETETEEESVPKERKNEVIEGGVASEGGAKEAGEGEREREGGRSVIGGSAAEGLSEKEDVEEENVSIMSNYV